MSFCKKNNFFFIKNSVLECRFFADYDCLAINWKCGSISILESDELSFQEYVKGLGEFLKTGSETDKLEQYLDKIVYKQNDLDRAFIEQSYGGLVYLTLLSNNQKAIFSIFPIEKSDLNALGEYLSETHQRKRLY